MSARAFLLSIALLAAALGGGCKALNNPFSRTREARTPAEVAELVQRAEADIEAGRTGIALEDLRKARNVRGLPTELYNRIDLALERGAERRVEELSKPGTDPDLLGDLLDLNLPRQIAITAGVRAARLALDQGEAWDAYRMIQKVDKKYPPAGTHHERAAASAILVEAGLQLSKDDSGFLGFFRAKDDAKAILEYLVLNYPTERRCDEAYFVLAGLYEADGILGTARQRYEDLVTYHYESPHEPESEARIPRLRLRALRSPEYDRRELLRARIELEHWLERHAAKHPELEEAVRYDYADCLQRLVENDLSVARFYERVSEWTGARLHAERALRIARETADERVIARAQRTLDGLPAGPETAAVETAPQPAEAQGPVSP